MRIFTNVCLGLHGGQGVCGHLGLVVSMQDCQSWSSGFKSRSGHKFGSRFQLHLCPLANSALMSTLTAHCQCEDEKVKEMTGHPTSYAVAKKMKSLTLHTHGHLKGLFFFSFILCYTNAQTLSLPPTLKQWAALVSRFECTLLFVKVFETPQHSPFLIGYQTFG